MSASPASKSRDWKRPRSPSGSGMLPSFADILIEMDCVNPDDVKDRRNGAK